jgi:hypothetical protein
MTAATGAVILLILAMTGAGIKAIAEIVGEETTGVFITVETMVETTGITLRHIIREREPITRQTIT